jgi:DNA-directed RNA polymerase subunit RPC12/RpoP
VGRTAFRLLEPVADPGPARVLDLPGGEPVRGDGQRSYGCGSCGAVLFEDLAEPYTVRGIAVRCPVCGRHSRAAAS